MKIPEPFQNRSIGCRSLAFKMSEFPDNVRVNPYDVVMDLSRGMRKAEAGLGFQSEETHKEADIDIGF